MMASSLKRSWRLQDFVAHGSNVNCVALGHKSGRVLVTGGDDKKVNLWAVGKVNCIMSLRGHTTPVECVQFGYTEEFLCAGSQAGALKIWDLEAAKIVRTLTGHKSSIRCIDFHPYGDFLTSGSLDTSIKLWDIRRKGCIFTYPGHKMALNSVKFSPDGQWIASGGEEGLVKLWDLRVGRLLKEFVEHQSAVTAVKFHPNEFLLASSSADHTVNFWDLENFQLVSSSEKDVNSIRCITFSPDGECLFTASQELLKVHGWEPARTFDVLPMSWGKVQDIACAHKQLIGASCQMTNVVLHVVDLSKVQPFGGVPFGGSAPASSPFHSGQSIRKSFSREKPFSVARATLDVKTIEEAERSGTDPEDEPQSFSTDIPNMNDYQAVFQPNRKLNRTPPPEPFPAPLDDDPTLPQIVQSVERDGPSSLAGSHCLGSASSSLEPLPSNSSSGLRPTHPESTRPEPARPEPIRPEPVRPEPVRPELGPEPALPQFSSASSPRLRAASVRRLSSCQDSAPTFPEVDFPVKLNNMRHSPSEPSLNRPNSNHNRSLSLNRNLSQSSQNSPSQPSNKSNPPSVGYSRPAAVNNRVGPSPSQAPLQRLPPASVELRIVGDGEGVGLCGRGVLEPATKDAEPEFVPMVADRPSGIDMDDFLPKSYSKTFRHQQTFPDMSEAEVLSSIMRGHDSMMTVLTNRQRSLQIVYSLWHNKDLKSAVDSAVAMNDLSVLVDLLGVMTIRPSVWNLDLCAALLPAISELLQSKYEMYMTMGCDALRLILRNFSPVIKTNVCAPIQTVGVDISREERYQKCVKCYEGLMSLRSFLLKRQTLQGKLGGAFRELHTLMQSLD